MYVAFQLTAFAWVLKISLTSLVEVALASTVCNANIERTPFFESCFDDSLTVKARTEKI